MFLNMFVKVLFGKGLILRKSADGIAPDGQMADPVIFAVGSKDTVG